MFQRPALTASRRAVLALFAGGAALVGGGATALVAPAPEVEADAAILQGCLDWLDALTEANRLGSELMARERALGKLYSRQHPEIVAAWGRLDAACYRSSDLLDELYHADATSITGVFAKMAAVALLNAKTSIKARGASEVLDDLVRQVSPKAGPLVRRILAHPALADVLGEEGSGA